MRSTKLAITLHLNSNSTNKLLLGPILEIMQYGQVPTQLIMDKDGWNDYIQNADLDTEPNFEDA